MTLTPSTIGRLIIYVRKLLVARCRSLVKVGCYAHLRGPPALTGAKPFAARAIRREGPALDGVYCDGGLCNAY